ncbi:MAG: hypothetical protein K2X91_14750, partial [Thermoleophilia bacterium]|nr:hypothetical protein [Thermoleophilia bacterium]
MPIVANCSGCQACLTLRDDRAGQAVRCPRCATLTTVPHPGEARPRVPPPPLPAARVDDPAPPPSRPEGRLQLAVVGGIAVLLVAAS